MKPWQAWRARNPDEYRRRQRELMRARRAAVPKPAPADDWHLRMIVATRPA